MTTDQLKSIFEKEYCRDEWRNALREIFHIKNLFAIPHPVELGHNDFDAKAVELGNFETYEGLQVGLYEVEISPGKRLDRNKVGLRNLMRKVYQNDGDAALIVFTQGNTWRFTYASDLTVVNNETGKRERKTTDPKRYTYVLGHNRHCRTAVERFSGLKLSSNLFNNSIISINEIEKAFSVETLTKQFYKELFDWYQWSLSDNEGFEVKFPNDTSINSDDRNIEEHIIRLITRLMFVWFIKQKNLVPNEIFSIDALKSILKEFDPLSKTKGNYYNAVLQNFFFATLNKAIEERAFAKDGDFFERREHYGIKSFFRNPKGESWFKISNDEVLELFSKTPFLNGGLFECLDKVEDSTGKVIYNDGFSREERVKGRLTRAFIPNCLFFHPSKGLIPLLEKYNFTIEESTPIDVEVALDPELLGKVFENLLGAYNPETKETARKQSGSFYTPREIVHYMVDESLIEYLKSKCPDIDEIDIRTLFTNENTTSEFNEYERHSLITKLKSLKILDPACGSGAFPMGVLNRIVELLEKLEDKDSDNRYEQKLHIIENCIYGIDIQTIAVQISKLRFFISLVSEQTTNSEPKKNYGIVPLPNLETKFVAANTLIGLEKDFTDRLDLGFSDIRYLKDKLWEIRSQHFSARNASEKQILRIQDEKLRKEIQTLLVNLTSKPDTTKIERIEKEIDLLIIEKGNFLKENLVELIEPAIKQGLLFDIPATSKQIAIKIDKNLEERKRIDKLIKEKQKEIEKEKNKTSHSGFEKEANQLAKWDPYDQNISSSFFDAEWMFNVNEGFDILIGNPPYVEAKKLKSISHELRRIYSTYSGTADLYVYFYESGLKNLKHGGTLVYITSNKFIKTSYGENLRNHFTQFRINQIVDFTNVHVFDALVASCIISITRTNQINNSIQISITKDNLADFNDLRSYIEINSFKLEQSKLSEKIWQLENEISLSIKEKIESGSIKLNEIDTIKIFRGITTGYNPAFIIDNETRSDLIARHKKNSEIIKPLLQGRNIRRWIYNTSNEYLLFIPWHFPLHTDTEISGSSIKAEKYLKKEYPILHEHLLMFKEKLLKRNVEETGIRYEWYALQRCAASYYSEFESEKIVWGLTSDKWTFAYDNNGSFLPSNGYILTSSTISIKYLLALMNSKLMEYYFNFIGIMTAGGAYTLKQETVSLFPIKVIDECNQLPFIRIVNDILTQKKADPQTDVLTLEKQINRMVYRLYNLTSEEVKLIDPEFSLIEVDCPMKY